MSKEVEDLVRSLYLLGFVQREIGRRSLVELGSQGFTSLAALRKDGPLRVSEVAERLCVDVSVASRQVNALIDAGYAQREHDDSDGRAHKVSITEAGVEILARCHRRLVETFAQALAGWSDQEIGSLAHRLDLLREDFSSTQALRDRATETKRSKR
ncbi:MAG: hypothetical protein QG596_1581 [Actinomycetota bacterium]|jgi:DNA-binding MarR family transcriptional regulator|nr:hypothetical protein [Actinomycetota bacterium]